VYVTEQYPKGLGKTVPEIAAELEGISVYEKQTFSSAQTPEIVEELKGKAVPNVILAGMEAHVCVLQTAFDFLDLGFNVHVAADACCSQRKLDYTTALERLRTAGVTVTTTEAAIFELLYSADTVEFKKLRHIFKE
jgi:nicotinamidase-related amidase